MTQASGASGRAPLRVYLAGGADPEWRLELLREEAHEAYAVAVQTAAGDTVLHGALPYGHTMVGPFQVRWQSERGELLPREVREYTRARHLANPERWRMRAIARADIVFAWLPATWRTDLNGLPLDVGAELGLAYGTGKAVILAAESVEVLERAPLLTELAWKMVHAASARRAYEHIMADLDVTFERGMARITSNYGGQCTFCRGSYKEGEIIYWSKPQGGMHVDCYNRLQSESANPDAVVFNSELVHALRTENADLEKECLELMTKNSMLEQEKARLSEEKAGLQKDYDELYVEYEKWLHP